MEEGDVQVLRLIESNSARDREALQAGLKTYGLLLLKEYKGPRCVLLPL